MWYLFWKIRFCSQTLSQDRCPFAGAEKASVCSPEGKDDIPFYPLGSTLRLVSGSWALVRNLRMSGNGILRELLLMKETLG